MCSLLESGVAGYTTCLKREGRQDKYVRKSFVLIIPHVDCMASLTYWMKAERELYFQKSLLIWRKDKMANKARVEDGYISCCIKGSIFGRFFLPIDKHTFNCTGVRVKSTYHFHVSCTTQYLWHPSTLNAEIWCVAPRGQTLHSHKISVQMD